ncbi:hypothetical protein Cgig2_000771 [Carnegiea gigantea]|uniref:Uncharacterized protein n=1 Tax=Carnegiea gigantea TaxID=171969 RepID=A0A9Q1QNP4_9CARY|nr:hypothetical protein Cgig2_000771 [Carnegiea gigantea]
MQYSLYLHPDQAIGKDKHKCDNVYTSRKRSKKHVSIYPEQLVGTDSNVGGAPADKGGEEGVNEEAAPTGATGDTSLPRNEGGTSTAAHHIGGSPIRSADDEHIIVDAVHEGSTKHYSGPPNVSEIGCMQTDVEQHPCVVGIAYVSIISRSAEVVSFIRVAQTSRDDNPPPTIIESKGSLNIEESAADKAIWNYLLFTLSENEEKLLCDVHKHYKSFKQSSEWSVLFAYLNEGGAQHSFDIDVRGLMNIVPRNGSEDKAINYCISRFAIDHYSSLLDERQRLLPK